MVSDIHQVVTDVPIDEIDVKSMNNTGNISLEDNGGQPIKDIILEYKSGNKKRQLMELKALFTQLKEDHACLQGQHALLEKEKELMMMGINKKEDEMKWPGGVTGGSTSCFMMVSDIMSILLKHKLLQSNLLG